MNISTFLRESWKHFAYAVTIIALLILLVLLFFYVKRKLINQNNQNVIRDGNNEDTRLREQGFLRLPIDERLRDGHSIGPLSVIKQSVNLTEAGATLELHNMISNRPANSQEQVAIAETNTNPFIPSSTSQVAPSEPEFHLSVPESSITLNQLERPAGQAEFRFNSISSVLNADQQLTNNPSNVTFSHINS